MSLTWGDWLRFIVTPLVVAGITAIVATRNAKKTPHERLKNLVDIHKNMPANLDSRNVVESAIVRELVDFDRRLAADQRGFWAGVRERAAQLEGQLVGLAVAAIGTVGAVVAALVEPDWWGVAATGLVTVATWSVGLVGARAASKAERVALNRDRAAAEMSAHFSGTLTELLSKVGNIVIRRDTYVFNAAERLTDMGVFERELLVETPEKRQVFRFTLTPFGRDVLASALAEADRRTNELYDLFADESGEADGEGDTDRGRGAPGA